MCQATLQCISRLSPAACHASQCAMQLSSVYLGCLQQHVMLPNVPCNSPVYLHVVSSSMSCFPMCQATLQCISTLSPAACHASQCARQLSSVSPHSVHYIMPCIYSETSPYGHLTSRVTLPLRSPLLNPKLHSAVQIIGR